MVNVKIKKLNKNVQIPQYQTQGASGMDLRAFIEEDIILDSLDRILVPTGLIIELPKNYEAQIRPRSGMSIKHGITLINCIGTIDEDYRGEICVGIVNLSKEKYVIKNGDRIAQIIFSKVEKVSLVEENELSLTQRNIGGFGSTGY